MLAAINVRTEHYAVILHFGQCPHAKGLEATTIGEDWPAPAHELVQTAHLLHNLKTGAQIKMVRVGEEHGSAQRDYVVGSKRLHRCLSGYGKEDRQWHDAMGRTQARGAASPVSGVNLESKGLLHDPPNVADYFRCVHSETRRLNRSRG